MRLGIDFDNTIVCYDRLFHRVCVEQGLIPATVAANKSEVRNFLRAAGREEDWTLIQGYVYGARMLEAEPFPGILEFLSAAQSRGLDCWIISHKTRYPYLGERYDLHQSARQWLQHHGFLQTERTGLAEGRVYFAPTKREKVQRIAACGCTHYIDDLPEFLAELRDMAGLARWLFDPNNLYAGNTEFSRISSWNEALSLLPPLL